MTSALPRLGWVAAIDRERRVLSAWHGPSVEVTPDGIVEGVWSGDFQRGDFHEAEHFFGSGLRTVGEDVWLVPSSSTVDRLVVFETPTRVLASNSLVSLLAFCDGRLDEDHDYMPEAFASNNDLASYQRRFPIVCPVPGKCYQVFQERVIIDSQGMRFVNLHKPRDFSSFPEYLSALRKVVEELDNNLRSPGRKFDISKYSTISSGYDSPAVTTLVRDIGIEGCFSIGRSNSRIPKFLSKKAAVDDGSDIADMLGVRTIRVEPPKRGQVDRDELDFLTVSAAPSELAFYSVSRFFRPKKTVGVLFTGHHGGAIWGHRLVQTDGSVVVKGDFAGLNLSETRLNAGFIHVPIPAIYLWSAPAIYRISNSPEMSAWRVGGAYDRPIPRRILEEAGVPRELFGYRKKAVVQSYDRPFNRELGREFRTHVKASHGTGAALTAYARLQRVVAETASSLLQRAIRRLTRRDAVGRLGTYSLLSYHLFTWAVERSVAQRRGRMLDHDILVGASETHDKWNG